MHREIYEGMNMEHINVQKASILDAALIHTMQIKAFKPLLEKYQDFETNPANEVLERVVKRLKQKQTDYYLIVFNSIPIGAIRIVSKENHRYRVSPLFVLPEYQGRGIAKATMKLVEEIYPDSLIWELETILQERKLCQLYEGLGYRKLNKMIKIKDDMNIIYYEKQMI